jgi:hypothetical protein
MIRRAFTALLAFLALAPAAMADPQEEATGQVQLTLEVIDDRGFELLARTRVPRGTAAFEAMTEIIQVEHRKVAGRGPLVTALCGIAAPRGQFWALYVGNDLSPVGIGEVVLQDDTRLTWRLAATRDYRPSP